MQDGSSRQVRVSQLRNAEREAIEDAVNYVSTELMELEDEEAIEEAQELKSDLSDMLLRVEDRAAAVAA